MGESGRSNKRYIMIPELCPCCGKPLEIANENGRKTLVCLNESCEDKIVDKYTHFASREGMNIIGLSSERIRTLVRSGLLKNQFREIYDLHFNRNLLTAAFGKKMTDKLLEAIETSKDCKLSSVLVALGVPGIGKQTARGLEQRYYEVDLKMVGGDLTLVANNQNPVGVNNSNRENYLKAADDYQQKQQKMPCKS